MWCDPGRFLRDVASGMPVLPRRFLTLITAELDQLANEPAGTSFLNLLPGSVLPESAGAGTGAAPLLDAPHPRLGKVRY